MSAILTESEGTSFLRLSSWGKAKFLLKLVVFILTMGYVFPRLLVD